MPRAGAVDVKRHIYTIMLQLIIDATENNRSSSCVDQPALLKKEPNRLSIKIKARR